MTSSVSSPSVTSSVAGTIPQHQDLWLEALRLIKSKVQHSQFITWFKDTAILERDTVTIVLGLPLPMSLSWHNEHYRDLTLNAIRSIDESVENVEYRIDVSLADDPARTIDLLTAFPQPKRRKLPNRPDIKIAEGIVSKMFNPRYSFEQFVVGSNNRLAYAACQAVANQPGGKYNPLFIYGGVGLGKTHLLQSTGNAILKHMPHAAVSYTTSEDFTNEVVEAMSAQKMEQFRKRYRMLDVLIIDDVQFLAHKERTQEEFFHTFNTLYEDHKQVIISADRPPQELQLEARLTSRFERGMIADLSQPDYETKLAILLEKAQYYELFLDRQVLECIAQSTTRNVRDLEGILMQAVAQYELEQCVPTVGSITRIMEKFQKPTDEKEKNVGFDILPPKQSTAHDVLEMVSGYYSVTLSDLVGPSRVREILIPRQIAMYIMKQHLRASFVTIGEYFGNRDHTTVMNAMNKMNERLDNDAQMRREVRGLERELGFVTS